MPYAKIIATGAFLPAKVVTNFDLEKVVDTTDEWIRTRTGIRERRISAPDEPSSVLAANALTDALDSIGMDKEDLDYIIVATVTPDTMFPSTACWLQKHLHITHIPAVDVSAACSGFMYGLSMARAYIESGMYKTIAVIGVEELTKITNWEDRSTCVLFGDGAGAAILQATEDEKGGRILSNYLGADGRYGNLLVKEAEGTLHPASHETIDKGMHYITMEGQETFKHAVRVMKSASVEALKRAGLKEEDLDLVIPHQANIRIIDALANRLKVDYEKVQITIDRYANSSSATIPIALNEANRDGKIKPGDAILMVAFGGGLTWGSVVVRW